MLSLKCEACGSVNESNARFCLNCGVTLSQTQPINSDKYGVLPEERGYLIWGIIFFITSLLPGIAFGFLVAPLLTEDVFINTFLMSFIFIALSIVFGIPYAYYIYLNFKDFNDLHVSSHNETKYSPVLFGILFAFLPIISHYIKYNMLHKHYQLYHNEPPQSFNPILIVSIIHIIPYFINQYLGRIAFQYFEGNFLLFSYLSLFFSITFISLTIFFESKWQKAFNLHTFNHKSKIA